MPCVAAGTVALLLAAAMVAPATVWAETALAGHDSATPFASVTAVTPSAGPAAALPGDVSLAPNAPAANQSPEFDAALNRVIQTLDNDQSRTALLAQLKDLRTATAQSGADDADDEGDGLLDAFSGGFDWLDARLRSDDTPLLFWGRRFALAERQAQTLFARSPEPPTQAGLVFLRVLGLWAGTSGTVLLIVRLLERRLHLQWPPPPDAKTRTLLVRLLGRLLPWVLGFLVAVHFSAMPQPSLGRMLALTWAYAILGGALFRSVCVLLFSLFDGKHRRPALRILALHGPALLFSIGALAAIGDATGNARVLGLLGHDLAISVSTLSSLSAAVLTGMFVLRFRRPVAHLIRVRHGGHFGIRMRRLLASLWHWPMLLLVTASALATLFNTHHDSMALRRAIASAGLLVLSFLATAMIHHGFALAAERRKRRPRASPYSDRFLRVGHVLLIAALWFLVVDLATRLWGGSLLAWLIGDGRRIASSAAGIGGTIIAGWLLWIVLDTAIREAISPSSPRRGGGRPSARALTMLPLVRNALFVVLLVIGIIATLANLGIDVAPLLAGAGVIGIALGLGAQTLVKDLLTGIFILLEDTLAIGDVVEMDGRSGTVEGLTVRTVRLRDADGAVHAIPFSEIKTIKNQSREFGYAAFSVRVTYDSDVEQTLNLIRETAAELEQDPELRFDLIGPLEVFGLERFDAGAVVLQARIKTLPQRQYDVKRAFNRRLKDKIDLDDRIRLATGEQFLRMLPSAIPLPLPQPITAPMNGGAL